MKVAIQRHGVVTQRSSDKFGGRLCNVVRLYKFVPTHVHFEYGMYAIEVIERDPGKIFDDAINEEFAHPRRIRSLSCCPL